MDKRQVEVWFTRVGDNLYYALNYVDKEPKNPRVVKDVKETITRYRERYEVVMVGIVPPDALGLE
jgi:hypothetical protein